MIEIRYTDEDFSFSRRVSNFKEFIESSPPEAQPRLMRVLEGRGYVLKDGKVVKPEQAQDLK